MRKPIIGITLDHENDQKYSLFPYYALRENYVSTIAKLGSIPILLGYENPAEYLALLDAIVITGGNFDIPPEFYGEKTIHQETKLKGKRSIFERNLCQGAIEKKIPILGICGGMQLINIMLGGSLIQHIPDEIPSCLNHEAKPYDRAIHQVSLTENSLLYRLNQNQKLATVNSSHHQAVKEVPTELLVSALAPDGVIEAIESISDDRFILGVQWHPEYLISEFDRNIFLAFIQAAASKIK